MVSFCGSPKPRWGVWDWFAEIIKHYHYCTIFPSFSPPRDPAATFCGPLEQLDRAWGSAGRVRGRGHRLSYPADELAERWSPRRPGPPLPCQHRGWQVKARDSCCTGQGQCLVSVLCRQCGRHGNQQGKTCCATWVYKLHPFTFKRWLYRFTSTNDVTWPNCMLLMLNIHPSVSDV